jgi:hypothetical protein
MTKQVEIAECYITDISVNITQDPYSVHHQLGSVQHRIIEIGTTQLFSTNEAATFKAMDEKLKVRLIIEVDED